MIFYLGTDSPHWLKRTGIPLFVSRRRLAERCKYSPVAMGPWALDSGAFTELKDYGRFTLDPLSYANEVRQFQTACGKMAFAAPQDWMYEPIVIDGGTMGPETFVGTDLSVLEHQERTVENYLLLKQVAPDLPWIPVLQGWTYTEYLHCLKLYEAAGVDLEEEPLVGLGSVCRRQDTAMVEYLVRELHEAGIRLHAFGFKLLGLRNCARYLASSDSMAWSYEARRGKPLPGCKHRKCHHCMKWALTWREKVLRAVEGNEAAEQAVLF